MFHNILILILKKYVNLTSQFKETIKKAFFSLRTNSPYSGTGAARSGLSLSHMSAKHLECSAFFLI